VKRAVGRPSLLVDLLERVVRERGTAARLRRFGLEPVEFVEIPVERLHVQRPVLSEVSPSREATTLDFLDGYFTDERGHGDWRIRRSMQAAFLTDEGEERESDYWQWHVALREAGIDERPDEWIARKVRSLRVLYRSIESDGFRYGGLRSYVWALDRPLISTRYGLDHRIEGYEIYDGHHRAAVAASLGLPALTVLMLRDVATHTAFGIPLADVTVPG
jgi:hypothetical protein